MPRPDLVFELVPDLTPRARAEIKEVPEPSPWLLKAMKMIDRFEEEVIQAQKDPSYSWSNVHNARVLLVLHLKARDDRA